MNSKQAANKLKVSVRSLQRLAHKHNLTVTYVRGKSGKQEANYDADEIARLKDELATPIVREQTALATIPDASRQSQMVAPDASERFAALVEAITRRDAAETTISDLAAKPLLTIHEAQRLTSLSRETLLEAHHAGKLKLITIGRGYKVKNKELMRFIDKL